MAVQPIMPFLPLRQAKRFLRFSKRSGAVRGYPETPSHEKPSGSVPHSEISCPGARAVAARRHWHRSVPCNRHVYAPLPSLGLGVAVGLRTGPTLTPDHPGTKEALQTCCTETKERLFSFSGPNPRLGPRLSSSRKARATARFLESREESRREKVEVPVAEVVDRPDQCDGLCHCFLCHVMRPGWFRNPEGDFVRACEQFKVRAPRDTIKEVGTPEEMVELLSLVNSPLSSDQDGEACDRVPILVRRLRECQHFLARDRGIFPVRLPVFSRIQCGSLRSALRECYGDLSPADELSIKTSQKLEDRFCKPCELRYSAFVQDWKEKRFRPSSSCPDHVRLFSEQFGRNVETGWNQRQYPYVPNGHATLANTRREGGNWNTDRFEDWCRPELVLSSGKPRVVTLFSEYNTRVLTPLHLSLYAGLRKRGWVLVGDPEEAQVNALNGDGDFVSLDYRAATDSFKTVYVRAAIEVLISKAVGLTDDQVRCLRVLGELRLERGGEIATVGQPMGSVMSFPLLCLFNKTLQDLALNDCLQEKKLTFKEWTCHRLLVNGDDGLTRNPRQTIDLKTRITDHGTKVGMEVNDEKTMVASDQGEINSTLFAADSAVPVRLRKQAAPGRGGVSNPFRLTKRVKSNCSALAMKPDVADVLGFAAQSSRSLTGFVHLVRKNAHVLAKQNDKFFDRLPPSGYRTACLEDPRIRKALKSSPASVQDSPSGYLSMSVKPSGYDLERCEEVEAINAEVARVRDSKRHVCSECTHYHLDGTVRPIGSGSECDKTGFETGHREAFRTVPVYNPGWKKQVLHPKRVQREELTLSCLVTAWSEKKKREIRESEVPASVEEQSMENYVLDRVLDSGTAPGCTSRGLRLVDSMRKFKKARQAPSPHDLCAESWGFTVGDGSDLAVFE